MSDLFVSVGAGLLLALFPMFFILLNRFLKHAVDFEKSNPKDLNKQLNYVWENLFCNDRKLILTSFVVSWMFFSVAIFAITRGFGWVSKLGKIFDKFGDLLIRLQA
jgi:hypothetical protein